MIEDTELMEDIEDARAYFAAVDETLDRWELRKLEDSALSGSRLG